MNYLRVFRKTLVVIGDVTTLFLLCIAAWLVWHQPYRIEHDAFAICCLGAAGVWAFCVADDLWP